QSLAIRLPAHDNAALEVLDSPRYDFTRRSRVLIDQYRQWAIAKQSAGIRIIIDARLVCSFGIHNQLFIVEKIACQGCRRVEVATSVFAQIQNELLCTPFL